MEDNKKKYPTKSSLIIRIAAAAYLLYLAWGLRGALTTYEGMQKIFFLVAIILFVVVSVVIGGSSLKAFLNGDYEEARGQDEEGE